MQFKKGDINLLIKMFCFRRQCVKIQNKIGRSSEGVFNLYGLA